MKAIKIAVKIGSHLIRVGVKDKRMACEKFIEKALVKCKILSKRTQIDITTYVLFERLNGIEIEIDPSENIYILWATRWKTDGKFELIIRKYIMSKYLNEIITENKRKIEVLFNENKKLRSEAKKFLLLAEHEIKKAQMKLKRTFISDASYFDTEDVENLIHADDDQEVARRYYKEINQILMDYYVKALME